MLHEQLLEDFFCRRDLSPEDLNAVSRHRDSCIEKYRWQFSGDHGTTTAGNELHESVLQYLKGLIEFREAVRGRRVIELGPGSNPLAERLLEDFEALEYVGVEMNSNSTLAVVGSTDRVRIEGTDALSYLLTQPTESAIVVSIAMLDPMIYGDTNMAWHYNRFLGREIFRVTPRGKPTFHAHLLDGYWNKKKIFYDHGFEPVIDNPSFLYALRPHKK